MLHSACNKKQSTGIRGGISRILAGIRKRTQSVMRRDEDQSYTGGDPFGERKNLEAFVSFAVLYRIVHIAMLVIRRLDR